MMSVLEVDGSADSSVVAGIHRSHLDPRQSYTCLTVIINALEAEWLPAAKPQLYALMLELMYILAEDPVSSHAVLSLLRHHAFFDHQLDTLLCSQLPDEVYHFLLSVMYMELHIEQDAVTSKDASARVQH